MHCCWSSNDGRQSQWRRRTGDDGDRRVKCLDCVSTLGPDEDCCRTTAGVAVGRCGWIPTAGWDERAVD